MSANFYTKDSVKHFAKIKDLAPEQLLAFQEFDQAVFQEGPLSDEEKEIVAVAIAHVTECPFCIDIHTKKAKKAGATLEELTEAVFVVSAIEAGGAVTHSTHVHNANEKDSSDVLYARSNLQSLGKLGELAKDAFNSYKAFSAKAVAEGKLSSKFKEIIAVAVATATQCPYCIDVHTKNAKRLGATDEQLAEAIMVSSALRAGGAYAHMAVMIESYES